jgi:hypothetical protein
MRTRFITRVMVVAAAVIAVMAWGSYRERHEAPLSCELQLRRIHDAKNQWALENHKSTNDTPTWADLVGPGKPLARVPTCPSGGVYSLGPAGTYPRCSIPSHND